MKKIILLFVIICLVPLLFANVRAVQESFITSTDTSITFHWEKPTFWESLNIACIDLCGSGEEPGVIQEAISENLLEEGDYCTCEIAPQGGNLILTKEIPKRVLDKYVSEIPQNSENTKYDQAVKTISNSIFYIGDVFFNAFGRNAVIEIAEELRAEESGQVISGKVIIKNANVNIGTLISQKFNTEEANAQNVEIAFYGYDRGITLSETTAAKTSKFTYVDKIAEKKVPLIIENRNPSGKAFVKVAFDKGIFEKIYHFFLVEPKIAISGDEAIACYYYYNTPESSIYRLVVTPIEPAGIYPYTSEEKVDGKTKKVEGRRLIGSYFRAYLEGAEGLLNKEKFFSMKIHLGFLPEYPYINLLKPEYGYVIDKYTLFAENIEDKNEQIPVALLTEEEKNTYLNLNSLSFVPQDLDISDDSFIIHGNKAMYKGVYIKTNDIDLIRNA